MKTLKDFSAEGYVPASMNFTVKNMDDVLRLGAKKIEELITFHRGEEKRAEKAIGDFKDRFHGPKFWEAWTPDARWGGDKERRYTFRDENLPADERQAYEALLKEKSNIECILVNLRTLRHFAKD